MDKSPRFGIVAPGKPDGSIDFYLKSQFKTLKYRPGFPARFGSIKMHVLFAGNSFIGTTASVVTAGLG